LGNFELLLGGPSAQAENCVRCTNCWMCSWSKWGNWGGLGFRTELKGVFEH